MPDVGGLQQHHLLIGAIAALVTAVLVPLQGMVREWLAYKAGQKTGKELTNEAAKAIPPAMLQSAITDPMLIDALHDIARAFREGTAAEVAAEKDRLALAIEHLVERLDGDARRQEHGRRRGN